MKKIINNGKEIYIQRDDIRDIISLNQKGILEMPEDWLEKFKSCIEDINDYTQHEFVKFNDTEIVAFLSQQDWILDYDFIKMPMGEFNLITAKVDARVEELLEKNSEYLEEYDKPDANHQLINQKLMDLYKELMPLMIKQSNLSSRNLLEIRYGGLIGLEIPEGIVHKK